MNYFPDIFCYVTISVFTALKIPKQVYFSKIKKFPQAHNPFFPHSGENTES